MIIAIVGCSGSGKTLLTDILVQKAGCFCPIHTTTRKYRKDDKDFYKYVSIQEFLDMIKDDRFFIASGDGIRYYGVEKCKVNYNLNKENDIVINASIKDINQLANYNNILIVMTKYKHLLKGFLKKGYKVVIVDNLSSGHMENIEKLLKAENMFFYNVAICDRERLDEAFKTFTPQFKSGWCLQTKKGENTGITVFSSFFFALFYQH